MAEYFFVNVNQLIKFFGISLKYICMQLHDTTSADLCKLHGRKGSGKKGWIEFYQSYTEPLT